MSGHRRAQEVVALYSRRAGIRPPLVQVNETDSELTGASVTRREEGLVIQIDSYLLERGSQTEVHGVIAHEIAHVALDHNRKLGAAWRKVRSGLLAGLGLSTLVAFKGKRKWLLIWPAAWALIAHGLLGALIYRFELEADQLSATLLDDPRPYIEETAEFRDLSLWKRIWRGSPSFRTRADAMCRAVEKQAPQGRTGAA